MKVLKWKSCPSCGSRCTPVKEGRIGGVPIVLDSDWLQPENCNGVLAWAITKLVLANQKPKCVNSFIFIYFNSLVKRFLLLRGGDLVFVWFQEFFFWMETEVEKCVEAGLLGFFLGRCWEVALSYGACWSEIEAILWKARVVICSSSDGRSGFVSKLPRNKSGFNCLVPLLGLGNRNSQKRK